MIDRKVGDKPITFEVSVGKCVKLFSKAEGESQEQEDAAFGWRLCRGAQLQSRAYLNQTLSIISLDNSQGGHTDA